MTISYNWLKDYFKADISLDILSETLTSIGLEVESIESFESIKGGLKDLVIGEVLTREKHPNADTLSLTTVNLGGSFRRAKNCLPLECSRWAARSLSLLWGQSASFGR
ncbi:MAG: hypothetical protein IPK03_08705 [Bacteroidetes bacterium]|nr:hypothetical protein [Bacteroidota bacterium]